MPRSSAASIRQLWSGGRLILATREGELKAFSDTDGSLLWSHLAGARGELRELAADGRGQLLAVHLKTGNSTAQWPDSGPVDPEWLLETLNAQTGATLRQQALSSLGIAETKGLVIDAQDNIYITTSPLEPGPRQLVSYSPNGSLRFRVSGAGESTPAFAAFNGELLLGAGDLRSSVNGSLISASREESDLGPPFFSVMSSEARFLWLPKLCCERCDCAFGPGTSSLMAHWPGSQTRRFIQTVGREVSFPTLLDDGSVLFSSRAPGAGQTELRAIDAEGNERFACGLGVGGCNEIVGMTILSSVRWAAVERSRCATAIPVPDVLHIYEVPGLRAAASGWTGPLGSPGRTGRPR